MIQGLSSIQVDRLLKQYGHNVIAEQKKKNIFSKFIEQFNNFLTILLIIAAGLSFSIGEPVDGILIFAIVILNALFGIYQEAKAEQSINVLKKMTITKIRVLRDGRESEIDSKYLVPGDIMFIEEGVKIPADGTVIDEINLEINESALTGESLGVGKTVDDEIFSGTIVAKGRGRVRVLHTGMQTRFGQIAARLSDIEKEQTPLQKKLASLTRFIGILGIIAAVIVFVISFIEGTGYFPAFLLSISLAVAVVPEGLPAVMTITLAIGVGEMAKKKAIIRKLSAIEALGNITLIATDKTGTLTTNKMKVKEVFVDGKTYLDDHLPSIANRTFSRLVLNGILCSTASLVYIHDRGRWDVLGDPTEGALLFLGQKAGLLVDMVRKEWVLEQEVPFDSVTKKMSVTVRRQEEVVTFIKGAPESVLLECEYIQEGHMKKKMSEEERRKIIKKMNEWAGKGLRVLAFSYTDSIIDNRDESTKIFDSSGFPPDVRRGIPSRKNFVSSSNDDKKTFLGMVAIHDAPRPEVVDAVERAKQAGIKIIMITGDNEKTAEAIGVTSHIMTEGDEILTGKQLDTYSDKELLKVLPHVKIFARTSPFQKHRIVKLFQELGEIVAVTGDGVNDAIALKQADVGVAMGLVGTDVARETADMVITDDNFASIVNAVEEGRNIIKNLKNAIKYLLSCNMSEAIALIIGLFLGIPHLFYPIQLLYINLVTDGFPALALAFSPRNPHHMKMPPNKETTILPQKDRSYIFMVGSVSTAIILFSYFLFSKQSAAFTVLTLIQSFILIDLWLSHQSMRQNLHQLKHPLFIGAFVFPFIMQYFIVSTPFTAEIFKVKPISLPLFCVYIFLSSLVVVGIKVVKKILKLT